MVRFDFLIAEKNTHSSVAWIWKKKFANSKKDSKLLVHQAFRSKTKIQMHSFIISSYQCEMRCAEASDWMIKRKYVVQLRATEKSYRNYFQEKCDKQRLLLLDLESPKKPRFLEFRYQNANWNVNLNLKQK